MRKTNLTPLLVLLPLSLFVCLYYSLFYLFVAKSEGLREAGLLLLSLSIGIAALLIVERVIVYRLKGSLKKIWIAEIIGLLFVVGLYYNRQSSFYYQVSDETKWFAVFVNEEGSQRKSRYAFPFNRVVDIDSNEVLAVSRKEIAGKKQAVKASGYKWRGYSWRSRKVTVHGKRIQLNIYCRPRSELTAVDYEQMEGYLLNQLKN